MRSEQSAYSLEKLSSLVDINIGKTPARKEDSYWGGAHSWVSIADLKGKRFIEFTKEAITDKGIQNSGIKIVPSNTILFSFKLSIGKVAITKKSLFTNEAIASFPIKDSSVVNQEYLYYVLRELDFTGSGDRAVMGKTLNKAKLKELKIPLPPLAEQQKIAAILDAADSLRQKDQQLIEHYTALSQSLFLEMFGDPVGNPMGWEISTIEKVLEGKSQNGLYLTKDKYLPNGIEMVHMSDAFYETVNPGSLKKVELTAQEMEKYKLSVNDLLLARRSLTYEGAAKPCLIPEYDKPLVYESSLIRISPKLQKVNTLYLYFFFSNQRARNKFINKYISRSTISGINNKGLNSSCKSKVVMSGFTQVKMSAFL